MSPDQIKARIREIRHERRVKKDFKSKTKSSRVSRDKQNVKAAKLARENPDLVAKILEEMGVSLDGEPGKE
jgi:hypothetical protein